MPATADAPRYCRVGLRNKFPTWCCDCNKRIPTGQGRLLGKNPISGRWRVLCRACEPKPAGCSARPPRAQAPPPVPYCFQVLGLVPPVGRDEVRSAYRALAREHHPDHGGDARRFIELKAAYDQAIAQSA